MAKITCYLLQIEALSKHLYNPNSKKAIRIGEEGEVLDTLQIFHPSLESLYKRRGRTLEIEEKDFEEIYNKFTQIEHLKKETTGLTKRLLSNIK